MINLQNKRLIATGSLLLFTALLAGACSGGPLAKTVDETTPAPTQAPIDGAVSAEGRLTPLRSAALSFLDGGEIGELSVKEGDAVAAGQVIARLGKYEPLEAALSEAKLELLSAQQALDALKDTAGQSREQSMKAVLDAREALNKAQIALNDLDTEEFQDEIDDLNIAVQDARNELDDAEEELDKYRDLDPDNETRKDAQTAYDDAQRAYDQAVYDRDAKQIEIDRAKQAAELASADLEEAERKLTDRTDGVATDDLELAQARVSAAEARVSAAQRLLDNTNLTAPFDGTVADLRDLEVGEIATPGQTVATLADFSTWIVETRDLTEIDVVHVAVGQEVWVVPDALPDLELKGTVESIAQTFTERSGDIVYTVRIRLSEDDPRLRWGMTVSAVFER